MISKALKYLDNNVMQKQAAEILADMLPKHGINALDLGAGPGPNIAQLSEKFENVFACDIDPEMLSIIKSNANSVCCDANNLPFRKNSFDLIYSNMMLQWSKDLLELFKLANNVCKLNGELIATTLGPATLKEAKQALASINRQNNINTFIDLHSIGDLLAKAGWQNIFTMSETIELEFSSAQNVFKNLKSTSANIMLNPKAIRKTISPRVWQKCLDSYPKKDNKCIATYEIIVLRAQKKLPKHAIDPSSISRSTT